MAGKRFNSFLFIMVVLAVLCPGVLSAQTDNSFVFFAFLQKNQSTSTLRIFSEQNPVTYMVFYGQVSGNAYFVRREDIFSSDKLVCQFGGSITSQGITAFVLEFNKMTGIEMMAEEQLEAIGELAWANRTVTGNSEIPYVLQGALIAKDAKSKRIFETLVMGQSRRVD
jgi:hypothetical protein